MFKITKDPKQSIFIDAVSHARNLFIPKKLLSYWHDVTEKIHSVCDNLNETKKLVSSGNFIGVAKVSGHWCCGLEEHTGFHNLISRSSSSLFVSHLCYIHSVLRNLDSPFLK